jgi:hypothetical protein
VLRLGPICLGLVDSLAAAPATRARFDLAGTGIAEIAGCRGAAYLYDAGFRTIAQPTEMWVERGDATAPELGRA